ncbi:Tripeptidyl aminopeptidase precursor [Corynebacterium ciconiae DSM 44920]|uniref:alpha/beta fold hydrolase n=1 Tax=Corynebacterium ciconiae TaxID=227319 RepID=UPI00037A61DA|nr:alpha/beta fold hydrolase [Corynebacterium ciconiae]WKD60104.1 Tripeptidyl aminopeptidase precursor [Corynebacterium ciconiae DSM 44920]
MKKLSTALTACVTTPLAFGGMIVPTAHAQEPLEWGPCPAGSGVADRAVCATFSVPKDYSDPSAGSIELTMSKLPATGERKGVIAGNPGGPGGDALGMFADTTPKDGMSQKVQLPDDVRSAYDLIAVEPRGLTYGTPLTCASEDTPPIALPGAAFANCEKAQPGYARTITTDNTARDLERARIALGEDQLNLYGVSYGGPLMSTYATMYPERVNKFLLDSSVAPQDRWFALGANRKAVRQEAISAFFSWVADNNETYHLGGTPREVYQSFNRVIRDNLGVTPALKPREAEAGDLGATGSVALDTLTTASSGNEQIEDTALLLLNLYDWAQWRGATFSDVIKTNGDLNAAMNLNQSVGPINMAMYSEQAWPMLAKALSDSAASTPAGPLSLDLGDATAQPTAEEQEAIQMQAITMANVDRAVICNENATAPDPSLIVPYWETALTGGDFIDLNGDQLGSGQHCLGWPEPVAPARPLSGEKLKNKPLNLGYSKDSAVGPHGAPSMKKAMGGELITLTGYSHGVLINNAAHVAPAVSAYFR